MIIARRFKGGELSIAAGSYGIQIGISGKASLIRIAYCAESADFRSILGVNLSWTPWLIGVKPGAVRVLIGTGTKFSFQRVLICCVWISYEGARSVLKSGLLPVRTEFLHACWPRTLRLDIWQFGFGVYLCAYSWIFGALAALQSIDKKFGWCTWLFSTKSDCNLQAYSAYLDPWCARICLVVSGMICEVRSHVAVWRFVVS